MAAAWECMGCLRFLHSLLAGVSGEGSGIGVTRLRFIRGQCIAIGMASAAAPPRLCAHGWP